METTKEIIQYQNELFNYIEEFFIRVTGQTVTDFGPPEEFSINIKKNPEKLAGRLPDSLRWVDKTIRPFYADKGTVIYSAGRGLGDLSSL